MNTDGWQELIKIQQEEENIFTLKKRLDQLQNDNLNETNLQRIRELENILKNIGEKISKNDKEQRKNENELTMLNEQRKVISEKLYGGDIYHSKELNQLQNKLDEMEKKIGILEEKFLSLMLEKEDLSSEEKKVKENLALYNQEYEKTKNKFELEQAQLKQELKSHFVKRKKLVSAVSQELYDWYNKLRKEMGGKVLVPVVNGSCGGCHVVLSNYLISRIHFGKELLTCENCGRILYWNE